jgi:hypothetical protein
MHKDLKFLEAKAAIPKPHDKKYVAFMKDFIIYFNNMAVSISDKLLRKKIFDFFKVPRIKSPRLKK